MTSITESFRRRITNAELVLPLVDDTLPQVRIRLDLLKEMLDEIDAEHERRMEQAVEATLGRGTCHDTGTFKSWGLFTCSNCSIVIPLNAAKDAPEIGKVMPLKFCPNCGRRFEVDA